MSRPPFAVPPVGVRAHRLVTRRGEFAVLDAAPRGERPIGTALLIPGYTGSKEDFIALLAPLAEAGYRAVAVDGRGQFESSGALARSGYGLGALAEDVLAQAEELGPDPIHLVGHSLGGLIARGAVLRAAVDGRKPFASLTLIASGAGRVGRWHRIKVRALAVTLPVLGAGTIFRLVHRRGSEGEAEIDELLRRRWMSHAPAQLRATGRTLRFEPDRVARLAAVGLPAHVLSGERDGVWPVRGLDRMAHTLRARRTVIRGARHSPNAERPDATASALTDFWSTLWPAAG